MKATWPEMYRNVYAHLQDEESRDIFLHRLEYSATGDDSFLIDMIRKYPEGRLVYDLPRKKAYIFGAGVYGGLTKKFLSMDWQGYIDNDSQKRGGGYPAGLPIFALEDVPRDAYIFISSKYHNKEIFHQLRDAGFKDSQIINLGKMIADMSRDQYFDLDALTHVENESFADVGVMNGDTTRAFLRWTKENFEHVYCFEPDAGNADRCRRNLLDIEQDGKLTMIPKGAWSEDTTLSFSAHANGTSGIGAGDATIETTTLDEVFADRKITFIKMDIEGAEYAALCGGKKTIRSQRPKLAICVYHKPEDIIDIPQLLLEYQPDYRFYLRHYCIFDNETVLYAI